MSAAQALEPAPAVELLSGGDPIVMSRLVGEATRRLLGGADSALVLTELREEDYSGTDDGPVVFPVVDAAQTPPMLSDRRVVVARHLGLFAAADLQPLIDYLAAPLATTRLLLVWEKGSSTSTLRPTPQALIRATEAVGGAFRRAEVGRGKAAKGWLSEQLADAPVRLDRAAANLLTEHIGEDRTRIWAILDTLVGAYGRDARVGVGDLAPFLGARGTVPPWELTDAIGKGDIGGSLTCLGRLCGPEAMHPMQVLALLRNHFDRVLHLDASGVRDEAGAAELLREAGLLGKGGSTFPARRALEVSRRLGPERVREAVGLLAAADVDLRGRSALEPVVILEVLVARLSRLNRR